MNADYSKTEVEISQIHWKIHTGDMFYFSDVQTSASNVEYLIRTGAKQDHMRLNVFAGAGTAITLTEGVTTTVVGTPVPIFNFNRNSATTPVTLAFRGPTYSLGSVIDNAYAGAGSNPGNSQAGTKDGQEEFVLKPSTDYILKLAPSVNTTMSVFVDMYEV